jgi:hypothetical protein
MRAAAVGPSGGLNNCYVPGEHIQACGWKLTPRMSSASSPGAACISPPGAGIGLLRSFLRPLRSDRRGMPENGPILTTASILGN